MKETTFKLDTGEEVTDIIKKTYQTLNTSQLSTSLKILYAPSQQPLKTIGQFWRTFSHKDKEMR